MAANTCRHCRTVLVPRQRGIPSRHTCTGRGLCGPCYWHCWRNGTLADYPRRGRPRDELLAEFAELRGLGYGVVDAVALASATLGAVEQAMRRARATGTAIPEADLRTLSRLRSVERRLRRESTADARVA